MKELTETILSRSRQIVDDTAGPIRDAFNSYYDWSKRMKLTKDDFSTFMKNNEPIEYSDEIGKWIFPIDVKNKTIKISELPPVMLHIGESNQNYKYKITFDFTSKKMNYDEVVKWYSQFCQCNELFELRSLTIKLDKSTTGPKPFEISNFYNSIRYIDFKVIGNDLDIIMPFVFNCRTLTVSGISNFFRNFSLAGVDTLIVENDRV